MKYLKYFEEVSAYEAYKNGSDFITPNVSYVVETNGVSYTRGDFIIMTSESNPEVMKVCYNQGWAASPYEMYASEAANVTSIGTAFQELGFESSNDYGYSGYGSEYGSSSSSFTFSFDEFKYFTGVTTIEYNAFFLSKIVSITIPNSVTSIGDSAFMYCTRLTSIIIPDSVILIDQNAFKGCSNLTNVHIGSGVTSIGNFTFESCSNLTNVHIGSGVTSIGNAAFQNCKGLTSITIPDSVTEIGRGAFAGCLCLTGELIIPDSVTSIAYATFASCRSLTSITIPNSVTEIGQGAFMSCSGLASITIPDSVTLIGADAFNNCTGLTSITIPDSVTEIGRGAFAGCSNLNEITCFATASPRIYADTFIRIKQNGVLKYPAGSDYSSWMRTSSAYLGYYNWTTQEI